MSKEMSINPTTGEWDLTLSTDPLKVKAIQFDLDNPTAHLNPEEGYLYIDPTDHKIYVYYGGTWQVLHTLTPASLIQRLLEDGSVRILEDGAARNLESVY